jgi:hypothetical protein
MSKKFTHGNIDSNIVRGHTHRRGFKWWQFIRRHREKKMMRFYFNNLGRIAKSDGEVPKYK